ncbi:hypothetical protein [Sphingosinicella sp. CPCC 101087]|uniref:hypothetical protein n=1 Tax=Sphingosinicella sp. CPCC 101087 TaxID=2497754 RepID=UPI00101C0331|nr:hypothetical protein [Sphingosinicella sp. CPCC 101087]
MPQLRAEPVIFGLAWAALAVAAALTAGWIAGAALSVGLMLVIMPVSSLVLTRAESFRAERLARWGILAVAALAFALLAGGRG